MLDRPASSVLIVANAQQGATTERMATPEELLALQLLEEDTPEPTVKAINVVDEPEKPVPPASVTATEPGEKVASAEPLPAAAPKLPNPPVDGPDVTLKAKQDLAAAMPGARAIADRKGGRWQLGNQGRVHMLLAAHSMIKIDKIYGSIFENILGEKVTTKPVEITTPFPWAERGKGG